MEPERRIEKLLRAFAKKRREQAGDAAALRPVARQRLHQEISRRSPHKSASGFFSNLFLAFRPRLAFALCFVAVVFVGGWLLLPVLNGRKPATLGSANSQLAKASPSEPARPMLPPTPVAAPPPLVESEDRTALADKEKAVSQAIVSKPAQPTEAATDQGTFVSGNGTLGQPGVLENGVAQTNSVTALNAASAPPSAEAAPAFKTDAVTADSFASAGPVKKDAAEQPMLPAAPQTDAKLAAPALALAAREQETQKTLAMEKAPAAVPPGGEVFDANLKAETTVAAGAVVSQNFYRLDVPAGRQRAPQALSVPTPVLASFRVEQNGGFMRVVDADGSVYTGAVQVARNEDAPLAAVSGKFQNEPTAASAARRLPQAPAAQNYFFRVSGTNRNLRQNVVFSGNLIPLTTIPLPQTNAGAFGGAAGTRRALPELPASLLLSNSRISGTAVIGNRKKIEVNATPAPQ